MDANSIMKIISQGQHEKRRHFLAVVEVNGSEKNICIGSEGSIKHEKVGGKERLILSRNGVEGVINLAEFTED